jgi:hypothetical protein
VPSAEQATEVQSWLIEPLGAQVAPESVDLKIWL